jgi:hypothetical protein
LWAHLSLVALLDEALDDAEIQPGLPEELIMQRRNRSG